MKVLVLGGIRISAGHEPAPVSTVRHQRIVAALVLAGPQGLSVDSLADRVWDPDETPASPIPTLRTYVKRLRSTASDEDGTLIVTRPGGYALSVDPDDVDSGHFLELIATAQRETRLDEALHTLNQALALWRGAPFDGLEDLDWVAPGATRLREARLAAQEHRLAVLLDLGTGDVAGEAADLLVDNPYRERLRTLRALALYRAGRQAEALADIAEHRTRMTDELGVDVSTEVSELEVAILRQDPVLGAPQSAGRALRGYLLGPRIGGSAHSVVHRATQPSVDRQVAVKIIRGPRANDPDFIRRFPAQATTVARLAHPHIVPLYDYWRDAGQAYVVLRWIEGGNLTDALAEHPLTLADVADVVAQVADALDFAHSRGVIHRNVKPSNVLLDPDGHAYLTDFGIATHAGGAGRNAGSLDPDAFTAPELHRGDAGPAADVFALGGLVNLMLAQGPRPPSTSGQYEPTRDDRGLTARVRTGDPQLDAALDALVTRATAHDPSDRHPSAGALAAELAELVSVAPRPRTGNLDNPYRGLAAFAAPDAGLFFGRDRMISTVLARLAEEPGVLVVGPSGCGKSSLVGAGIVPGLRSLPDPPLVTTMVPGADPFAALVQALEMVATNPDADARDLVDAGSGLAELTAALCPSSRVTLVVDQLEELFTLCPADEAEAFLVLLARALSTPTGGCTVLLSIRADFFDRPLESPSFGAVVGPAVQTMYPMTVDELVSAITEPARTVGVEFSEGLVARLAADVADQPGTLPLLQFALTQMFDRRAADRIDVPDYERVGGLAGALVAATEERFARMSVDEQLAVRRLMSRLVAVEGEVTGRRELVADMANIPGVSRELIDGLAAARLLTLDRQPTSREPTVELVHEALLDAWPRLRGWVDEDREHLSVAARLRTDAAHWWSQDRDPDLLYRGLALTLAEDVVADIGIGLSHVERDFVAAAVQVQDAEEAHAREQAVLERRRARRRSVLLTATAGVLAMGVLATVLGVGAAQQAADERDAAAFTELVGTATLVHDTRPDLGLLLAAEAFDQDPGPEAQRALLAGLQQLDGTAEVWTEGRFDIGSAKFHRCANIPEPGVLVVQPNMFAEGRPSARGATLELDVVNQRIVRRLEDAALVCDVRRLPGGLDAGPGQAMFAGQTIDNTALLVDEGGNEVAQLPSWSAPLFGPNGEVIARRGKDSGGYHVVDTETGQPIGEPVFVGDQAWLSPTASQFVVVGPTDPGEFGSAPITLLDAQTLDPIATLTDVVPDSLPAWGQGDALVGFTDVRGSLRVWDTRTGEPVLEVDDAGGPLVAISPNGDTIAVSTGAGDVQYRSITDGQVVDEVDPGQQMPLALEWIDDTRLAALGAGGVVSILSRSMGGLGERGPPCCSTGESSVVLPEGLPKPFAFYVNHDTGTTRFVDLDTGATEVVDMSAYWPFDDLMGATSNTREQLMFTPGGELLLVDALGSLVREVPFPVQHIWDDLPLVAPAGRPFSEAPPSSYTMVGVAEGERTAVLSLEVADIDAATTDVIAGPTRIDLTEPADKVHLQRGSVIGLEYRDSETARFEFRNAAGEALAEATLPTPVAWAVLAGDGRHVVAANASDDSVRVVDTQEGRVTVLPVYAEPQAPDMLSDGRFMFQTREGQYELWDAAGPTRIGVLADPGPYAWTWPSVARDESHVWIVLDGAWTRFSLDPREWRDRACALVGRSLTEQEWRDFVPGERPYHDACAPTG